MSEVPNIIPSPFDKAVIWFVCIVAILSRRTSLVVVLFTSNTRISFPVPSPLGVANPKITKITLSSYEHMTGGQEAYKKEKRADER